MSGSIKYLELKELTDRRLTEAKILLNNGQFDGARYLAGYALEFALKARIFKLLAIEEYPPARLKDFKTHDLEILILLAGLSRQLEISVNTNIDLSKNWQIANKWNENLRYEGLKEDAEKRASEIIRAIEDQENGILTWIKSSW